MASVTSALKNIPRAHMKHTKHLWIKAPFHKRLQNRCLHHDDSLFSHEATELRLDAEVDDDVGEHAPGLNAKVAGPKTDGADVIVW